MALRHHSHSESNILSKYWDQRYRFFTKYDCGIQLDDESWFSVTPETIALDIACKCQSFATAAGVLCPIVLDCFSGVGGNAIALACKNAAVIAVDIDMSKLHMLKYNLLPK